ncbi:WD repeat-containing protein 18 [Planococcus citri]|uniref:WD repeat-containing protein 18 n=1 Tax=Planococcus citri TaxID=170843 RepID=UPI0031F8BAD8
MAEINDVIFTSDTFGNMNVWDLKSGTTLMTYKSSAINARCMDVLNNDYVLAVQKGPLILAWPINSQEKIQHIKMLCPGEVGCFSVSPDGLYIAVSIENKLLIWQFATGKLLSTVSGHYQRITVITWTRDGSDVITGGEDGLVCVWKLSVLISANFMYMGIKSDEQSSQVESRYTFSDHSIRINDLYVGSGGQRARLYTASADKTCKIYDLATGTQLLSIVFDSKPCSIVVDPAENYVFVGTGDGTIKTFSLLDPPRNRDYHFTDTSNDTTFSGHTKQVNSLSISTDGTSLISGSADESVKIWHIESKQCLRTIRCRGNVTNVIVRILPKKLQHHDFQPVTVLKNFLKRFDENENADLMEVFTPDDLIGADSIDYDDDDDDKNNSEVAALREKIQKLEKINSQLYTFAAQKILQSDEPKVTKPAVVKKAPSNKIPLMEKPLTKSQKKRLKHKNKLK